LHGNGRKETQIVSLKIDVPHGHDALMEFILFQDRANAARTARWPANVPLLLPILSGESPFNIDREFRPLVVREGGEIVARAMAVLDQRYIRHWKERIGHVVFFEALPDAREATALLMEEACEWLRDKGAEAARTGMGMLDFPYVIDAYEPLPPSLLRQNPAHYHVLLKHAGFITEKGMVDYKIRVRPELVDRWESALEGARRAGYAIVPLRDIPEKQRVSEFTALWNDTFASHWGFTPFVEEEIALFFALLDMVGILDTSVIAYQGEDPVGMLYVSRDIPSLAVLAPGRVLDDSERLNVLGIGVRGRARGRGVNYAMASHAFLELVKRGHTWLSYTLVLDDNWPSRRTAVGLGADLCATFVAYRRNFER